MHRNGATSSARELAIENARKMRKAARDAAKREAAKRRKAARKVAKEKEAAPEMPPPGDTRAQRWHEELERALSTTVKMVEDTDLKVVPSPKQKVTGPSKKSKRRARWAIWQEIKMLVATGHKGSQIPEALRTRLPGWLATEIESHGPAKWLRTVPIPAPATPKQVVDAKNNLVRKAMTTGLLKASEAGVLGIRARRPPR